MFELRKTITVNGVSFDMILVEGDKFNIGSKEIELEDYYMAEIPVTQELYMAVMKTSCTCSYNMMPENFDYLDPNKQLHIIHLVRQESVEEYQKRLDREWREQSERESKERDRIHKLSKGLPVNNISWLECIEFIKKLNLLTGLNFALPSFEQWYFAAIGGIKSKGYNFAGSDDANAVGHFYKLSKKEFIPGVYVMTGECDKSKARKPASCWHESPKHYKPNELGLYDMSGLVNEWLDTPGKVIGGSFNSDPDKVSRNSKFGYCDYQMAESYLYHTPLAPVYTEPEYPFMKYFIANPGRLIGMRLILAKEQKQYAIPQRRQFISVVTDAERILIHTIFGHAKLGAVRSVVAYKVKERTIENRLLDSPHTAFSRFRGNIYNVFVCPQNLNGFVGHCFEDFTSRRKFVSYCKDIFISFLISLKEKDFNLLIQDDLGLNLDNHEYFMRVTPKSIDMGVKKNLYSYLQTALPTKQLFTTSPNISDNMFIIEIKDTYHVARIKDLDEEWIYSVNNTPVIKKKKVRIILSCFCDFNGNANDFSGVMYSDKFQTKGIVRFMRENIIKYNQRINDEDFDNSIRVNRLCKRNKGGLYEYEYLESLGIYVIQDERFYILPPIVYNEWEKSLKDFKS